MKKFTLLMLLFALTFGYSQTLPLDFQGTTHGFFADDAGTGNFPAISNGTGNDVLEVTTGVADWDNIAVTFAAPVDLSNDAVNTLRFTMQSTTAMPGEVHQHGVSWQVGGGAYEVNFQTIGTDVTNVELNFIAGLGAREQLRIFLDVGNFGVQSATGGQSGMSTVALSGTYIIDNIELGFDPGTCSDNILNNGEEAIDCGGPNCAPCAADTTSPTGFTATAGTVGGTSVELLLNATDDSGGDITYDVTYDGGGTAQTTGGSGVATSLVIENLTAETAYTFMVSASDLAGNPAANNAISVMATTTAVIAFPFTFDAGSDEGFIGDGGPSVTNVGDQLQIVAGASPWDNAQVNFTNPIDLSDAANNTLRFTIQSTTAAPGEIRQHGVSFQFAAGGGGIEANFQTVGQDVANVELNFGENLPTREKFVIFTDVNDFSVQSATGGQSGMNTNGLGGTYLIDDITFGADPVDAIPPTGFTATAGASTPSSVELLLNATDDSPGTITYDITYNGGANMVQTTGDSGVQTSFYVPGLTESTAYTFEVSAFDAAGNPAANNAISVMASTIADTSTDCAGFSTEALEGSFSAGYNYSFVTEASGTDVTVTFEILDTDKAGLVGEVFIAPSTFIGMTNDGANSFSATLTGQTPGADITFSGRFPYAGGLVRTKEFTYTVGDDCSGVVNDECGSATSIALATEVAFDNTGATDSGADSCFNGVVSDVWYSFVAPMSGQVTITVGGTTQYALFSDCSTEVSCNTSANVGLMGGNTYYVSVSDDGNSLVPGASTLQVDDTTTLSNQEFETISFSVYPNPTSNNWNIKGTNQINSVQVFDILGKQVMSLNPNANELTISSTTLNSGLYFARINSNTGSSTIKLVKE